MNQIHNSISILATRKPNDSKIYFNADKIRGKKINAIRIFASTQDKVVLSPFSPEMLIQLGEIGEQAMFLNVVDNAGNFCIKELPADYFTLDTEFSDCMFPLNINRIIDWDKTDITIKANPWSTGNEAFIFLIVVFYQNDNNVNYNIKDEINGSVTIEKTFLSVNEEPVFEDILLSKIIDRTLKNKRINQIIADKDSDGYLTLVTDKGTFDNIPLALFFHRGIYQLYFDNIFIDFDRSYIKARSFFDTTIKLTFIY